MLIDVAPAPTLTEKRHRTIVRMRKRYEEELFNQVLPFWETHSPDPTHGGYYNCLSRNGEVYDTTKYSWLQGRQAWMFSTLYRMVDPRDEWLAGARSGVDFLKEHAQRPTNQVFFSLTEAGEPIYQQRKIFSECFYVMALAGYAHATGDDRLLDEARTMLAHVWSWADDPEAVGRPVHSGQPEAQSLAVPMILLNLIEVVTDGAVEPYGAEIDACLDRIQQHIHADTQHVYENVRPDGSRLPGTDGRLLNPGHAIEAGWFMQHWFQRLDRPNLQETARNVVRWSFDTGWDDEHGGLFYFLDAEGRTPVQLEWFMKLWWPHCEALYAHLLNYALTREEDDWAAFKQVDTYTFDHFPDPRHGGWYGYLDREGRVTHSFKGAPYKGCFHVPRALWLCWRLLRRLEAAEVKDDRSLPDSSSL